MVSDLIYDPEAWDPIKERFPEARFTDASDMIHEGRFEVEVDADEDEWYVWLIRTGWANASFTFQLMLRMSDDDTEPKLWRWLEEAKRQLAEDTAEIG